MPSGNDNDFPPSARRERAGGRRVSSRRWGALASVLGGNAHSFLPLGPLLPSPWHHQPFVLDRTLGVDFLLCLVL